jgi:hypothetical protein
MNREMPQSGPTFGYMSAWDWAEHGYFGGYLIVSGLGRPLEFHCTSPVRPNRAQQILYGPTLAEYLIADQIGPTLLRESKLHPHLLLVDHFCLLGLRPRGETPVARLLNRANEPNAAAAWVARKQSDGESVSAPAEEANPSIAASRICVADHLFEVAHVSEERATQVASLLALLAARIELAEPFERIHEAIREAQRLHDLAPEIGQSAA